MRARGDEFIGYMNNVEAGKYPNDPLVPEGSEFVNDSGVIKNLAFGSFSWLALIESKKDTLRSNHHHLTDSHFLHVISGSMLYWWESADEVVGKETGKNKRMIVVKKGETIFTPPLVVHATYFPVDCVMTSLSRRQRHTHMHEKDLVRHHGFVTLEEARKAVK
jgi:mannose-6-phosphate isomerase-like protein (cupin superfamily)